MVFQIQKRLSVIFCAAFCCVQLSARQSQPADSLVRLTQAESVRLIEESGVAYRKAYAATFLHNGTYLISDTAVWNVSENKIDAFGHVRVIQDETVLTSDRLEYDVDASLAKFRGSLVQLQDKERNTLRTHYLDYNTKDSLAVFSKGGSLKASDGQVIESLNGTYESSRKLFTFVDEVNMFTDSIFIKTTRLEYNTERNRAVFPAYIDFWKDGNMLSASTGWYNRKEETFFFNDKVHILTERQEAWSDTLYYYRNFNDVLLLGRAQLQDTSRHLSAVADYMLYQDSLSQVTMMKNAAVALRTEQNNKIDTLYFGADSIAYRTVKMCDISEGEKELAKGRLSELFVDPVAEYRAKAAKEAAEKAAAEKAAEESLHPGLAPPLKKGPSEPAAVAEPVAVADSLVGADSLAVSDSLAVVSDSLAVADSLKTPPDTTKMGFLIARHNVKMFRKDMQVKCDSLLYCDLDSIARFYLDPIVWNEGRRQYSSDSLFALISGGRMERSSLMSNAFIHTQEDTVYYDQIKGTEIMAYFDTTSALRRFDALGGATAMFYLEENGVLATVNKVESKMLSATFRKGEVDRVYYYDSPKNDAYPVVQLPARDHRLKGFNWQPKLRPASKQDITSLSVRETQRSEFESRPKAVFVQTDRYFPGYMRGVYRQIAVSDSLKRVPKPASAVRDSLKVVDSAGMGVSATVKDSLVVCDSLAFRDSLSVRDSLSNVSDSTNVPRDSIEKVPSQRELRRAAREKRRAEFQAKRDARWKELDERDAARAEAKRQKALARKRERTRKQIIQFRKQEMEDEKKLNKFVEKYEKIKKKYNKSNLNGKTD